MSHHYLEDGPKNPDDYWLLRTRKLEEELRERTEEVQVLRDQLGKNANVRRNVVDALLLIEAKKYRVRCLVCQGTGLGFASIAHWPACGLADLMDEWEGYGKTLRIQTG